MSIIQNTTAPSRGLGLYWAIGLLALASTNSVQGRIWTDRADLPTPRAFLGASVVDGKIYAIGGAVKVGLLQITPSMAVEVYDPATDTWTRKADLPLERITAAASTLDGKIYVVGGRGAGDGGRGVLVYDPTTDMWTQKADLPEPRRHLAAVAVNGKLYAIGGGIDGLLSEDSASSSVFMYDPVTDTWTQKADMPKRGTWMTDTASAVDGKIYVVGVWPSSGPQLFMYDPTTDTWTQKADMPTDRVNLATAVVDGLIYAIGGGNNPSFGAESVVEVYDPATDTWSTEDVADLAVSRVGAVAAAVNGKTGAFSLREGREPRLVMGTQAKTVILLERVDLNLQEWQTVTIPLETLGLQGEVSVLLKIEFTGNLEGTFYLGDIRLVAQDRSRRSPPPCWKPARAPCLLPSPSTRTTPIPSTVAP